MNLIHKTNGYITLLGTLAAGAIVSLLVVSLVFFSLSNTQMSLSLQESFKARSMANLCAEKALQTIRNSNNYAGTKTLDLAQQGSCGFTVINTGGETRQITATGQKEEVVRKVEVRVSAINPQIQLSLWQEKAEF